MSVLKLINNTGHREEKNLCFVNASLQLLHSIPEVREFFKHRVYRISSKEKLPISDEISRIFRTDGEFKTSAAELRRLVGQYHRRIDICNGSQQDMEEFTRLLLESLEKELYNVTEQSTRLMEKFIGQEMNMRLFANTEDGACTKGHLPRSDPEVFRTIKLSITDTIKELSLNELIHNHYSISEENIMMKCSECCQHPNRCPQSGVCMLKEASEKKCILVAPMFLYIHLLRFANHDRKNESKVVPETILILPNGDKYRLLSIGNHIGSLTTNGHYQALIRSGSTWIKADDDKNYITNMKNQISGENYILLYKKFSTGSLFVPSKNWEEILEDQPIPPGLHIKLDVQTGRKFAKLTEEPGNITKDKDDKKEKISNNVEKTSQQHLNNTNKMKNSKEIREKDCKKSVTEDVSLNLKSNVQNGKQFLYIKGDIRFEELPDGKIKCNGCKKSFLRIIGHLKQNTDCKSIIDLVDLESEWKKFSAKKRSAKYYGNKKKEEGEVFLKKCAEKEKISAQKRKSLDKELYINDQNKRRRKCDQKKKEENEEIFLEKQAKRRKKCDQKKKEENEEIFLEKHAKRQQKCDQKKKEENEEIFLEKHAKRQQKCDQKKKEENEEIFLEKQTKRRKKCDQKKKEENKEIFLEKHTKRQQKCDQKKKEENEEIFLDKQTKRRQKCDHKKKEDNKRKFLDDQTKRQRKCMKNKRQKIDADERLKNFRIATRFGPIFVCRCCERKLFEHQVVEVDIEEFRDIVNEKESGIFSDCINSYSNKKFTNWFCEPAASRSSFEIEQRNFLCKSCKLSMEKGRMPKMCANNGLKVDLLPEQDMELTELENNMIALNIIFQKIHLLPKSRWNGTHDRLVNIPIGEQDIVQTLKTLPRTPSEAGLIPVALKRKLEYKTTHLQQMINIKKIYKFLHHLKYEAKNKYYQFYDDYNVFIERCDQENRDSLDEDIVEDLAVCKNIEVPNDEINVENSFDKENEKEDEEYRKKDVVRKYQFDYDMTTCMVPRYPEAIKDQECNVAPGEGKIPSNILKEDDWDLKSFPNLHPTGKYGLHQKREVKGLIDQQYIEQRLKNQDTRFEQCTPYVFACTAYIEEKQLERNIGISYCKGKKTMNESGERSYVLNDGFSVLDNVKGTPRYWSKAKKEMLAKLDNFGPFHFFYTLSCADMRWDVNFTSILREKGYNIVWKSRKDTLDNCTDAEVMVEFFDGEKQVERELRVFLEEDVDESLHEFIRTNVFIATRTFIQKLKAFRKEIMLGHNNPMAIENWSDKMEFQGRGAAHIHGVGWCNLQKISRMIENEKRESQSILDDESDDEFEIEKPDELREDSNLENENDLEKAFKKLRTNSKLNTKEEEALINFADRFVTCTLNPDIAAKMIGKDTDVSEGEKIVGIAKETQTHHHTKTCKKHSPDCRFGMPRYPIWKTLISKPIIGEDEEERRDRRIKHKETLKAVLEVLEDEVVIANIWKNYDKNKETKDQYVIKRKERIIKVLKVAGISEKCYLEAVQESTRKGVNVILARDIDEMYINNYNPEWIRAWNGNMDWSPCLDFFAVITYITEYFTKDESGTSNLLKKAAKVTSEMNDTQQKRHLKNVFLANRQMGISEAFMKLLPENRLKDSSIGTEFMSHGKIEDMSRFVVRADENKFGDNKSFSKQLFEVPGREGLYYEKPNWLDKYLRSGNDKKEICPVQYVKMYDAESKGKKSFDIGKDQAKGNNNDDQTNFSDTKQCFGKEAKFHHIVLSDGTPGRKLPDYIEIENPYPGEPKYMRKRKHPKALRFFKVRKDSSPARFFLQELMFFTCFDERTYTEWQDDDKCIEAYMEKRKEIESRKRVLMEWLDPVEEARYFVEENKKDSIDLEDVEVVLDAEKMQADLDCEAEEIVIDPQYEHLDLGNHNEHEFLQANNWCKNIELIDDEHLYRNAQRLDENQRKVLDICLNYAKGLVKARNQTNLAPTPPHLIVLGGAGSGKSTVIQNVIQWCHKTLQRSGDDPQMPYILATATTGAASVIIEGMTLHSALGFDFSNKHSSLSDKKRELKRGQCQNLKFLIVDEFSMMRSDQLYQVDLRLRELKQNNRKFGGIAIILLGDLAQLKPVLGRFAFDKPICEDYHLAYGDGSDSLWKSFDVLILTENHRQGNDKIYADLLNRVRVGEQTEEDLKLLKTRIRKKNHSDLKGALSIACKKEVVNGHNDLCLNNIQGKLFEVKAKHFTKLQQNFKPYVKKDGTISDTQFPDVLKLKIGARVMLIYNVDVSDLLCNGALGILIGIEQSKNGNIEKLIVKFDNPKAGKESRKNHPSYAKRYPGGTVIMKMEREYSLSKTARTMTGNTAKLLQYPIILAFAVTVYKIQGQTIERPLKCVIDLKSVFEGAQAYVMLSRMKEIDQLYILDELPENKMYPIEKALTEIRRLEGVSINKKLSVWDRTHTAKSVKISYLNAQSLINKFENVEKDLSLQQSDVLVLAETWILENMRPGHRYEIMGYSTHLNSTGRGKGLAIFFKKGFENIIDYNEKSINITKIEAEDIDIIAIYRSKDGDCENLIKNLEKIINPSKNNLVIGDMNICNKKSPKNKLKCFMEGKSFTQIVIQATHIEGGHLDHAYILNVGNFEDVPDIQQTSKYYSDHDAICITWEKIPEKSTE